MISLSIAKQKKVIALLRENRLHDNITIGKLFDIVGAVAKDIYNDNAFVYTIWYALHILYCILQMQYCIIRDIYHVRCAI